MIRWKKRIKSVFPIACVGMLLVSLGGCQEKQAESVTMPEILSIEYGETECKTVTYDEAVERLATQNGMNEMIGTQKLAVLQSAVQELETLEAEAARGGGQVAYYLLSQSVSIPEAGMRGVAVALIAAAYGVESEVYDNCQLLLVGAPVCSMEVENYTWINMAGGAEIAYNRTSCAAICERVCGGSVC